MNSGLADVYIRYDLKIQYISLSLNYSQCIRMQKYSEHTYSKPMRKGLKKAVANLLNLSIFKTDKPTA